MHLVTQILKLLELLNQHRVPQVEIGCRRIETGLDLQRHAAGNGLFELFLKFGLDQHLYGTAPDYRHLLLH